MKSYTFFTFLAVLLLTLDTSYEQERFEISFNIGTFEKIELECTKGCAWKRLEFSCKDKKCSEEIDQFGIYNGKKTIDKGLADFQIMITRNNFEYAFECREGCRWKTIKMNTEEPSMVVSDIGVSINN